MRRIVPVCLSIWVAVFLAVGAHSEESIGNDSIRIEWDASRHAARLTQTGRRNAPFAEMLFAEHGSARVRRALEDPALGQVDAMEIAGGDGDRHCLMVFSDYPFALIRSFPTNAAASQKILPRAVLPELACEVGCPPAEARTLGTGGLLPPDKSPGSYAFLAVADPKSRAGIVSGWITHDSGSGVIFSRVEGEKFFLQPQIDYGRFVIAPRAARATELFAVGWAPDAREGLRLYASLIAELYRIKLPPRPAGYCTWYAEKHGRAGDEKSTAELAAFCKRELVPFGMSFVQIDDYWQKGERRNGPSKDFTGHDAAGPYPSGMKATAEAIAAQGLTPGIWFMPFAGDHEDPLFAPHPEWFAKTAEGKPFETRWGGTCLDMTHPGAREHTRSITARIAGEWGYRYLKMDGLWTGSATRLMYVNDAYKDDAIGEARLHDMSKPNVEVFRDGLRLVRGAAGKDAFFLGCCAPQNMRSFGGSFGLVDAMRIGPDNGHAWPAIMRGPVYGSRTFFLNGRVWHNDPDPVYVRKAVPLHVARMIATWVSLSGQLYAVSDWLPDLPAERLDILKRTMGPYARAAEPADLFESDPPRVWVVGGGQPHRVIALYNWTDENLPFDLPLERLGIRPDHGHAVFDFWENAFLAPVEDRLREILPARSCRVLALRPIPDHPAVVSLSSHVAQTCSDLFLGEAWDGAAGTLRAHNRVVAGDRHEVRIAMPATPGFRLVGVEAKAMLPQDPGVKASFSSSRGTARIVLEAPANCEVLWEARFARAQDVRKPLPEIRGLSVVGAGDGRVRLAWQDCREDGVAFEVRRDGARVAVLPGAEWIDGGLAPGATHRYEVATIDFAVDRSPAAAAEITLAKKVAPTLGPRPPKPDVPLTSLKPRQQATGWGQIGIARSASGKPIALGGVAFADGIGVHAKSRLTYDRRPEWKRFVAVGGIDDAKKDDPRASVVLRVISHNGEDVAAESTLAESPVLTSDGARLWHFDVELPQNCRRVILEADDAGDGIAADHADWADAGFARE